MEQFWCLSKWTPFKGNDIITIRHLLAEYEGPAHVEWFHCIGWWVPILGRPVVIVEKGLQRAKLHQLRLQSLLHSPLSFFFFCFVFVFFLIFIFSSFGWKRKERCNFQVSFWKNQAQNGPNLLSKITFGKARERHVRQVRAKVTKPNSKVKPTKVDISLQIAWRVSF